MRVTLSADSRIYVSGHRGLVGSAVVRRLRALGCQHVLTATRDALDLRQQSAVDAWFAEHRPEFVIHAAGTVGGILANMTRPAEFIYDNLMLHATVVHAAHVHGVRRLLYLGSSCIYPRDAAQPIAETALLTGPLEPTNEPYAVAKIAGVKLCQAYRRQYGSDFVSAMPTNLYGPGDNFDDTSSHVLPALIGRFHRARLVGEHEVVVWGSGAVRREFMYVDDLADACVHLLQHYDGDPPINVGTGEDVTIREAAEAVRDQVHPSARIVFDRTKPDGAPVKRLDVSRLHDLGWRHQTSFVDGIRMTCDWYRAHVGGGSPSGT